MMPTEIHCAWATMGNIKQNESLMRFMDASKAILLPTDLEREELSYRGRKHGRGYAEGRVELL
jgi:hypothetical protein